MNAKIFLTVFGGLTLISIGWFYIDAFNSLRSFADTTSSYSHTGSQGDIISKTAQFAAVGDVLVHDTIYQDAQTETGYRFAPMFAPVKSEIQKADIAIANQETPVTNDYSQLAGYPRFNAPRDILRDLKTTGFSVINLANNHALDQGVAGLQETIKHTQNFNLTYLGTHTSKKDRNRVRTVSKNTITFAFRGYTYGTNGLSLPEDKSYMINEIENADFKSDISQAREKADVVVISLHFGNQYQTRPTQSQKELVKTLADYGADIILGHHPHVIQPMERIETDRSNDTLVAYSLGNFLADQRGTERNIGGILTLDIQKTPQGIELQNPAFTPTRIVRKTSKAPQKQFRIVPLRDASEYGVTDADTWMTTISERVAPIPTR